MKSEKEIEEQIAYCEQQLMFDLDEGNGDGAVINKKIADLLKWVLDKK